MSDPGKFEVKMTPRNLKVDRFEHGEAAGTLTKVVAFYIRSPTMPVNLMPSVPHRLLAMAIRRGDLRDYSTIEELIEGHHHTIRFKEKFQRLPNLLARAARGLSIDETRAMTGNALTAYLGVHGQRLGYCHIEYFSRVYRSNPHCVQETFRPPSFILQIKCFHAVKTRQKNKKKERGTIFVFVHLHSQASWGSFNSSP